MKSFNKKEQKSIFLPDKIKNCFKVNTFVDLMNGYCSSKFNSILMNYFLETQLKKILYSYVKELLLTNNLPKGKRLPEIVPNCASRSCFPLIFFFIYHLWLLHFVKKNFKQTLTHSQTVRCFFYVSPNR